MQFAGFLYQVCKILKPRIVVETGVFWGYSTACILQALNENNKGTLYSIDRTPQLLESLGLISGCIVPEKLKNNWRFFKGRSADLLPSVLEQIKEIDIFIHDSYHSYDNMLFEYQEAWPHIRKGGALLSHDVLDNGAFSEFAAMHELNYVVQNITGVTIKE